MVTWEQVLNREDARAVYGYPHDFEVAAQRWATAKVTASSINAAFKEIRHHGDSLGSDGAAVKAMLTGIKSFREPIAGLATVCGDIEKLLKAHKDRLVELKLEAKTALARAEVAWTNKGRHTAEQERLTTQRIAYEGALRRLEAMPTTLAPLVAGSSPLDVQRHQLQEATLRSTQSEITRIRSSLTSLSQQSSRCEASLETDRAGLETARNDFEAIREGERARNTRTIKALRAIELHGLKDPGFLDRVVGGVTDFFSDLVEGGLAGVLYRLSEALDKIGDILAKVGFCLLLVSFFVPGLNMVTLSCAVAVAALVVASSKLAVNGYLWKSGTIDPKTGRSISSSDLFGDALDVGFAAFGVKGALNAKSAFSTSKYTSKAWNDLPVREKARQRLTDLVDDRFTTSAQIFRPFVKQGREASKELLKDVGQIYVEEVATAVAPKIAVRAGIIDDSSQPTQASAIASMNVSMTSSELCTAGTQTLMSAYAEE